MPASERLDLGPEWLAHPLPLQVLQSTAGGNRALQDLGRALYLFGERRDRCRGALGLGIDFLSLTLFDRFAHGGKGLGAVAGVETGSVDQVGIPGATRESLFTGKPSLGLHQQTVELLPDGTRNVFEDDEVQGFPIGV